MQSKLIFLDHESGSPSDCGEVLDISLSSSDLDWKGVVLEKGSSPHFYPTNVSTPYFYFAVALEKPLHWNVETSDGVAPLVTSPGDIWINPPRTPFTHEISEPCYFVILAVEEEVFLNACPMNLEGKSLQFLNNYNVNDHSLKSIIDLFLLEVETKGRNGPAYLNHLLSVLSVYYLNNYSNLNDLDEAKPQSKFNEHQLATVDSFIDENMHRQMTIDEMADALRCSKFYFLREFKKLTGITPYQYLLNKRLDCAKSQLSENKSNIADIALGLGFNDQSHFTRAFKGRFGVTPGQFSGA